MNEEIRKINGVEICTESFGSADQPSILLIMGAMASMVWWDREFCLRLAQKGRFVIRFDNRDVGRSIWYPPGETHYSLHDLADDAVGVLDSFGIAKAHFVGMSLGGMIAQIVALKYQNRVSSITAIASSIFADRPDLPPIEDDILAYHASAATVVWEDEKSVRDYLVGGWRLLSGSRHAFDEEQATALANEEIRRSNNLPSMFNHARLAGGEELYGKAAGLRIPVLVIHGTEDPVLPYPHGKALADAIPGAKLVTLEGAGHELHRNDWDLVISEILAHTEENREGAWEQSVDHGSAEQTD
jgi:pimeloyl-ACP methyl ester carboxylesterase